MSPHDLSDWWVERYGRGLALNGAEVVYHGSLPVPFTENDVFEVTDRARALDNNMYVIAPNIGGYHLYPESPQPIDAGGGHSMIVDHRGQIVGKQFDTSGSTFVSGVIDIEGLRSHRASAQISNWAKDIRAELGQLIYERPIYPKNRYLNRKPPHHEEFHREVTERQIELLQDRAI
ncbi:nitrilase-related carbon-nitrogen hydrolase [Sciscionella marina]|uniref:nitrilase-related carbon-nitrogen hydrolase n=1 Tax=Sciscionella marina TaxID=508770 RepID=UPI000361AE44|nr:nitrilase-related carbon-nitrogen hydrolase [Sciscionella marina]